MRISDWSSDVCSSDLPVQPAPGVRVQREARRRLGHQRIAQCQQRDVFEDVGVVAGVEGVAVVHGIGGWDPGAGGWGKPSVSSGWRGKLSRSEEHTSELQSLMRISYDVFCLHKKKLRKKAKTVQTILEKEYTNM